MDDLDDWLDREAGLAALQGVCEGVSRLFRSGSFRAGFPIFRSGVCTAATSRHQPNTTHGSAAKLSVHGTTLHSEPPRHQCQQGVLLVRTGLGLLAASNACCAYETVALGHRQRLSAFWLHAASDSAVAVRGKPLAAATEGSSWKLYQVITLPPIAVVLRPVASLQQAACAQHMTDPIDVARCWCALLGPRGGVACVTVVLS